MNNLNSTHVSNSCYLVMVIFVLQVFSTNHTDQCVHIPVNVRHYVHALLHYCMNCTCFVLSK